MTPIIVVTRLIINGVVSLLLQSMTDTTTTDETASTGSDGTKQGV